MKTADVNTQEEPARPPASTRQGFDALLKAALAAGYPIAAWRLPGKDKANLLIDLSGKASRVHPDLEEMPGGFLFAPFETDLTAPQAEEKSQCYFLKADLMWVGEENRPVLSRGLSPGERQKGEALLTTATQQTKAPANKHTSYPVAGAKPGNTPKAQYLQLVQDSVAAIQRGDFQKNVCARTKAVDLPLDFNLNNFFDKLCKAYPAAFVSIVAAPGLGTWVGASPEVLISVNKDQQFCTVALAGTQPRQEGMPMVDAVWRQKEIEEQAMVSRYIINCLKKIRVREFEEIGPRTVAAANLLHLRTDYRIDLKEVDYPKLPTAMLQLLHPTSAVCGLPKEPAAAFLKAHEELDRSFFSGFLGPVKLQEETHLFVNLRCMQLFKDSALLFAGAGITADSVPEREWQETEHKCQTLLNIINQA
ncbi:MAG: chorismate-binding protein [Bacteroidetes bacterium]|nr:chorismate-binding protein [Bacteroidota bacterium]